jgi:AbrB family looped-hinge helix DNA binding protein
MQATVDRGGQMVLPAKARKQAGIQQGDVVLVEPEGDGRILLVRTEKPRIAPRKVEIRYRKGTHAVGSAGRPITSKQVRSLLSEFP